MRAATQSEVVQLTQNHQLWDRSEDIRVLQQALNARLFTIAPSGAGSPGAETTLFGPLTFRALIRFQGANGLPTTGFLGPLTRAILASHSKATSTTIATSSATQAVTAASAPIVAGNGGSGARRSRAVHEALTDTTAPSISLTVPLAGTTLSGPVPFGANAADDVGVVGVQFKNDGMSIGSEVAAAPYSISWDSTSVPDGTHSLTAVARDAAGNGATSIAITVTIDNTAPVRSAGSPSGTLSIGTTATTLSLSTDEAATCKYSPSTGTSYGSMSPFTPTGGASHSTTVSGLSNGGSYVYYVKCQDAAGNTNATDYAISFTVAADTVSPTVTVTSPSNNATVTGSSVAVSANASDDVSVAGVQFKLDTNTNIGAEDTSAPYSVTWNSTSILDGAYTLIAVAHDGAGNYATSSVTTVTVDNSAPVISSISSAHPGTASVTITWTTDEGADSQVEYGLTSSYGNTTTVDSTVTANHSVPISNLSSGATYHYRIHSSDTLGHLATSSDRTFSLTYPQATDSLLWGQRTELGLNQTFTNGSATIRYAVYQILIGVPDWNMTNAQFVFPNFYYTTSSPAEATTTRSVDILGAEIWSGNPDGGGTPVEALKFSGASNVSVPVASSSISDPLAATLSAGTPVYMRIAVDRNVNNGSVPIGLIRQHQNGEKWQYFNIQASSTGVLASGTLTDDTNTSSSRLKGYGPMLAVGKGWDGRKDVLLLGHSIVNGGSRAQTPDDAADSRGNKVYSAMAFDNSSLTGGRIAFGNLAVPGITPSQQSLDPYNSDYYYRKAAVQLIAAQQGGRYPFTDIFFDIAANGATSDATAWQSALDSGIAFAKTLFPGTPIVMPTMTARTTNLNSRFWTTLADQGFSTAADGPGPNAPRQLVNSYILTKPNIDMAIDLRSALLADQNDKWPVRSFAATLTANAAVGSTSVSLSAAPDIGSILVFAPGDAANGEIVNGVKSVSGSGPYTVTFGEQVSLTKAHSASATVAESPTSDGIHPGVAFSQIVKDAMVSVINALGLP